MAISQNYVSEAPDRAAIDALVGPAVLEFGTSWCGHCRAAQPLVETAFTAHSQVPHLKIEDGPGRPLGRSYRIKLWPTLVFLRDGVEVSRLVRPTVAEDIALALIEIDPR